MTTKSTAANRPLRAPRKTPAKPVQADRGNLSKPEITKLLMQAQEAFRHQKTLGKIEPGECFDDWRRDQVMDAVNLPGITRISRQHWRTVSAHFLTLCGRDEEAFHALTTTGPKRDHGPASDCYESSESLVFQIRSALDFHASHSLPDGASHIHFGWFLAAARQRTRKPTLTLDTLASRLDPATLTGLLSHLRNHISKREGRAIPERRSNRVYPSASSVDDPF